MQFVGWNYRNCALHFPAKMLNSAVRLRWKLRNMPPNLPRPLRVALYWLMLLPFLETSPQNDPRTLYRHTTNANDRAELTTTFISNETIVLERHRSPFLVKEDVFVAEDGELVVEPGVTLLFAPHVGITVRGILTSKVSKIYRGWVMPLQYFGYTNNEVEFRFSLDLNSR